MLPVDRQEDEMAAIDTIEKTVSFAKSMNEKLFHFSHHVVKAFTKP